MKKIKNLLVFIVHLNILNENTYLLLILNYFFIIKYMKNYRYYYAVYKIIKVKI